MKTHADVLREADPVMSETRSPQARAISRSAILNGPQEQFYEVHAVSRRRVLALAAALAAACIGGTVFAWRHASVDAVAAVRFEARLAESGETILRNSDIQTAKVVTLHDKASNGQTKSTFGIELTFTPDGAEKMRRVTQDHVGEHLQLLIDGDVVMAPLIRAAISGSAMLTGDYTNAQAQRIIDGLFKSKLELRNEK